HGRVARAQGVSSAADAGPPAPVSLEDEFAQRRRLLAGYEVVRHRWPERAAALRARLERHAAAVAAAGLDPKQLAPQSYGSISVITYALKSALFLMLGRPGSLIGLLVHSPDYRVAGGVAP